MRESSTYQYILQEGRVEGLAAGRREGRAEGENEGLVKGFRLSLTMFLEQKFGSIPPELESQIQAATDADRLEQALRQALTLTAITELVL